MLYFKLKIILSIMTYSASSFNRDLLHCKSSLHKLKLLIIFGKNQIQSLYTKFNVWISPGKAGIQVQR